jgi:ArsR family transcriptional regulator, arsenate/arsenite/antimonite-responsive transcriptional repressor / arsenate reductase (thioredoxin)
MTSAEAIAALAGLAQETRLEIIKFLTASGSAGLAAGELGARLKLSSAALSFHLNHLKHAGLVTSQRQSSFIIYDTKHRTIDSLIEYLIEHCRRSAQETARAVPSAEDTERRPFNVLFLCTHNSARSIMAECAMNRWGRGRFRAFSGGSNPSGTIHPTTLRVLKNLGYKTDALRSKNWNEFALADGPPLDFVFTLCDRAAAETCPAWPGQPIRAHWGIEDPVSAAGSDRTRRRIFAKAYKELERRIRIFTALPVETLEGFALERWVTELGKLDLAA